MQHLYAYVLLLVVMISLYIVYNPQCLSYFGIERFSKEVEVDAYELPY